MESSQSQDSFNAFLEATNDDDESISLKKPVKPVRGGADVGRGDHEYGTGKRGSASSGRGSTDMGSGYGGGASFGYGTAGAYVDPLASIDFTALRKPEKPVPKPKQKKEEQQSRGNSTEPMSRKGGKQVAAAASSEKSKKSVEVAVPEKQKQKLELSDVDVSDSESNVGSVDPAAEVKGGTSTSIFADMIKEMEESARQSAELEIKLEEEKKQREEEERRRVEEEKRREEEERKRKEEEEERRRKEEEERKRKEEEEAERKRHAEEEERRRKEEEERKKEEERRKKEEEEAARKREEEERRRLEEEKKRKEEEERKQREEEERKKKEEEEKQKRLEEEQCRREEEERRRAEEERQKKEAEEILKKQEEERRQQEELRFREDAKRQQIEEEAKRRGLIEKQQAEQRWREEQHRARAEMEEREATVRFDDRSPLRPGAAHDADRFSTGEPAVQTSLLQSVEMARRRSEAEIDPLEALRQRNDSLEQSRSDPLAAMREPPQSDPLAAMREQPGSDPLAALREPPTESNGPPSPRNLGGKHGPPDASLNSLPLMASVAFKDSIGSLPGTSVGIDAAASGPTHGQFERQSAQQPKHLPEVDEQMRLLCEGGKFLNLRPTESAEEEDLRMWRAMASDKSFRPPNPRESPTFDMTSSMPLGSAEMTLPGLRSGGAFASRSLWADDRACKEREGVTQRIDRSKIEALEAEVQGLRKKVAILEEHNTELANAKARAEAAAMRKDEQTMWLKLEHHKLEDAANANKGALREAALIRHDLEQRLDDRENELAEKGATHASEIAAARSRHEELASRVANLEAEKAGLREECDGLREDLASAPSAVVQRREAPGTGGSERGAGDSEVARLQSELEMTERMLRGAEKENENLAQQNRQLRQNARLRKEEVDSRQLKLVAELNAARASADTNPASMRRVSEVEKELALAKERAEELSRELERSRESNRQLERELLNGPPVQQAEASTGLADAVAARSRAEAEVKDVRQKLDWYVESQRQMEEDHRKVVQLNEDVRLLRAENSELKRKPGAKEVSRRAAELQKQVDELQECLRKRNPDSILSLVKACEPRPEERKELRDLKARVEELEAKLVDRDESYDRQVRALRAHYDHLRHEYEKRTDSRGVGGDTGATDVGGQREEGRRAAPDREAVLKARIQDLEKQVEHTKSYYLTKLRKREPLVPPKPNRSVGNMAAQQREAELQLEIRERDARIEELSKELHWRDMDGVVRNPNDSTSPAFSSTSLLRLFLAAPEAPPIVSLCSELRAMSLAARQQRYEQISSQAKTLVAVFTAEEAAAGVLSMTPADTDTLRLQAQPSLPRPVWSVWRRYAEQIAALAAEANLRSEDGSTGGQGMSAQVANALGAMRACVDSVVFGLICSPAGVGKFSTRLPSTAWNAESAVPVESLLPRLVIEHLREELDVVGIGHLDSILQDAQVHTDPDGQLRWSEFVGVLARCGAIGGSSLIEECHRAAHADWTMSLGDLQHLVSPSGTQRPLQTTCNGLVRALTRIRLVAGNHSPPLPMLFRSRDPAGQGFISRQDFMETLRAVHCALSPEERGQLAVFFAPASDPHWICYPLFLHSVVPMRADLVEAPEAANEIAWSSGRWANTPTGAPGGTSFSDAARMEALTRAAELEAENLDLRERVRSLTERCAESAALIAQTPAQAVRRLQGEIATLETQILEQQAAQSSGARKVEITLRGELDVSRHEVTTLRSMLEAKDCEVERYKSELDAIIRELSAMRGLRAP